jgi:hypothetical protein
MKTFGDFVHQWLDERPEYRDGTEFPVDDLTNVARPSVPMGLVDQALHSALRNAFKRVARARGMKAIRRVEGSTVYGFTSQLSLFEFVQVLREIRCGIKADLASARGMVREWIAEHPEEGLTVRDLWRLADPDAEPDAVVAA